MIGLRRYQRSSESDTEGTLVSSITHLIGINRDLSGRHITPVITLGPIENPGIHGNDASGSGNDRGGGVLGGGL